MNRKTVLATVCACLMVSQFAEARIRIFRRGWFTGGSVSYSATTVTSDNCTVDAVACENARMGRLRHLGGHSPYYEGIGCSAYSADAAIRNCCYWGRRQAVYIGTAQAANGVWYACVRYY